MNALSLPLLRTVRMLVTPQQAAKWLENAAGNRPLRMSFVRWLASEMQDGKFRLTHQGIAVSRAGRLLDGQHRLRAVMLSGATVEMLVTFDVPDESFIAMDAGISRTVSDRLGIDRERVALASRIIATMQMASKGVERIHPDDVAYVLDKLGQHIDALSFGARKTVIGSATVRAAFVVALAAARPERFLYIQNNVEAFGKSEVHQLSPPFLTLHSVLLKDRYAVRGNVGGASVFVRVWRAASHDPNFRGKIVVRDLRAALRGEILPALSRLLPDIRYAAGA